MTIHVYYMGHNADADRWELKLKYGDEEGTHVVARSIESEDKAAFEHLCRKYVHDASPAATRKLPRQLFIRNLKGQFIDEASYDLGGRKPHKLSL